VGVTPVGQHQLARPEKETAKALGTFDVGHVDLINRPGSKLEAEVNAPVGPCAGWAGNGGRIDDSEPSVMRLGRSRSLS